MAKTVAAILDRTFELGGITFDILANQRTSFAQQITRHPIESGFKITDHKIQEPPVLSFRAEIGNISITETDSTAVRAQDAYEKLKALFDGSQTFDYQSGFELFENMLFTTLDIVEEIDKPGALIFDATIEQLNITESEQVLIPKDQLPPGKTQQQLASEINRGQQDLQDLEETPTVLF
jgi:hypothetical protein